MTICIATPNYLPDECGITTFNLHLSRLLVAAGHRVIILTIGYQSTVTEEDEITVEPNGVIVVRLKKTYHLFLKKYSPYFQPGGFNAPNWIAMGYAMREWLTVYKDQYTIDIIEATDYGGISSFLRSSVLPPVVVTAHGNLTKLLEYNYAKKDDHVYILRRLEAIALTHADGVITHSMLHREELKQLTTVTVITATIPFELKNIAVVTRTGNAAVIVGGLQTIKGAFIVNAALRKLHTTTNIRIQWIGGDTYTAKNQLSVAKKLSQNYPELWGRSFDWLDKKTHQETLALVGSAAFVIIPSLWEAFNYVAIEAAALGKAIIITDQTGAAHLFTHNVNALIIPARNELALTAAIQQLATNKEQCERLGTNARQLIKERFSPGRIIKERIDFYTMTIATKGSKELPDNLLGFIKNYLSRSRMLYYRLMKTATKMIRVLK